MAKYAAQRLLMLPVILLVISLLVFVAIRLAPGDPAEMAMQQFATEESLRGARRVGTASRSGCVPALVGTRGT